MNADQLAQELMLRFGLDGFRILRNKKGYRFAQTVLVDDPAGGPIRRLKENRVRTGKTFAEVAKKALELPQ